RAARPQGPLRQGARRPAQELHRHRQPVRGARAARDRHSHGGSVRRPGGRAARRAGDEAQLMDQGLVALALITFIAAIVNGALGYGFSSLTVPVALLFFTNRVLNPVLVMVEVVINFY